MGTSKQPCPKCGAPLPENASFCPTCGEATTVSGSSPRSAAHHASSTTPGDEHFRRVKEALARQYVIEREVGRGGMATVYLAHDLKHNRYVAVKVLAPELASVLGPQRFLREIEITARLQHPHILPVHDSGEADGLLYYVMPFVEGESLRERMKRERQLPLDDALQLIREVAAALSYAHARDIVHRDIKPENILLSAGHAQVADFGIARAISAAGSEHITKTGAVVGTPAYMAPEQAADGEHIDGRADLYALAAVACEALIGQRMEMFSDVSSAERAVILGRPDLTPTQARVLAAPLALDRQRRPKSVEEWLDALKKAEHKPRTLKWVAALVTAVVLGALGGWSIWGAPWEHDGGAASISTIAVLPFSVVSDLADVDLTAVMPQAFEDQLHWLPEYRVLSAERVRLAVTGHFQQGATALDTLTSFVAATFGASEILWGTAQVSTSGDLTIEVQVRDGATQRLIRSAEAAGPLDSLSQLVSSIVSAAFAERVAGERTGWTPALPKGLRAFNAYYAGDTDFRRAAFDRAIERFDEVIERDSSFAPAYFKRMLAEILRTQPTRGTGAARSALDAARRYKAGLDPTTRELLDGYEILVGEGDLNQAQEVFQDIVERHPDAVDAWFMLGFLKVYFGALLNVEPTAARWEFEQVHERDPDFAAAIGQLVIIAVMQENEAEATRYMGRYLAIDSLSVWAELMRMADSLLYRGSSAALRVTGSLDRRPPAALEMFALSAGDFEQPLSLREVARLAINSLWERAATDQDRSVAFRMRMARLLGTGQYASADSLMRMARRRNVPHEDLDRWVVLAAVTGIATLADSAMQAAAAQRLVTEQADEPVAVWLAARWYRERDPAAARRATERLQELTDAGTTTPLDASLRGDLVALDLLAAGDTGAALHEWQEATRRHRIEQVTFGLVASLWPLQLERARVAAALADHDEVLAATQSFAHMAGFVDQVAWPQVWPLRARALLAVGDGLSARDAYAQLFDVLRDANGPRAALRDSVAQWLEDIRTVPARSGPSP
ncbi:MAG: protein kinase [Gemmatimonadota bacterium]|nr:MAG: protein kinase [Gemmatimonadota bacterium]